MSIARDAQAALEKLFAEQQANITGHTSETAVMAIVLQNELANVVSALGDISSDIQHLEATVVELLAEPAVVPEEEVNAFFDKLSEETVMETWKPVMAGSANEIPYPLIDSIRFLQSLRDNVPRADWPKLSFSLAGALTYLDRQNEREIRDEENAPTTP